MPRPKAKDRPPTQLAFRFHARTWMPERVLLTLRKSGRKLKGKPATGFALCLQCENLFEPETQFTRRCRNCKRLVASLEREG